MGVWDHRFRAADGSSTCIKLVERTSGESFENSPHYLRRLTLIHLVLFTRDQYLLRAQLHADHVQCAVLPDISQTICLRSVMLLARTSPGVLAGCLLAGWTNRRPFRSKVTHRNQIPTWYYLRIFPQGVRHGSQSSGCWGRLLAKSIWHADQGHPMEDTGRFNQFVRQSPGVPVTQLFCDTCYNSSLEIQTSLVYPSPRPMLKAVAVSRLTAV